MVNGWNIVMRKRLIYLMLPMVDLQVFVEGVAVRFPRKTMVLGHQVTGLGLFLCGCHP